jgi:hypothetical protein
MKELLELCGIVLGLIGTLITATLWISNRIKKRISINEQAKLKAVDIDRQILELKEKDKEHEQDIDEIRKDFAQFVQQLLFKTK